MSAVAVQKAKDLFEKVKGDRYLVVWILGASSPWSELPLDIVRHILRYFEWVEHPCWFGYKHNMLVHAPTEANKFEPECPDCRRFNMLKMLMPIFPFRRQPQYRTKYGIKVASTRNPNEET